MVQPTVKKQKVKQFQESNLFSLEGSRYIHKPLLSSLVSCKTRGFQKKPLNSYIESVCSAFLDQQQGLILQMIFLHAVCILCMKYGVSELPHGRSLHHSLVLIKIVFILIPILNFPFINFFHYVQSCPILCEYMCTSLEK